MSAKDARHRAARIRPVARPRAGGDRADRSAAARLQPRMGARRLVLRGVAPRSASRSTSGEVDLATPQSPARSCCSWSRSTGCSPRSWAAWRSPSTRRPASASGVARAAAGHAGARSSSPSANGCASRCSGTVVVLTLAGFYLTLAFAPLPAVGIPFLFGARDLRASWRAAAAGAADAGGDALSGQPRPHVQGSAGQHASAAVRCRWSRSCQMFLQRKDPPWLATCRCRANTRC